MKKVELLAPCGNYECFVAAVNAGADAVYLGGKQFGARAYADNFSEEELVRVIQEAHLFGLKVYLAVNTLVKEKELPQILDYMKPFYEAGLDGAIVQDMGVLQLLKRHFPSLALHASTQMTITEAHGAKFLKEQGCSRIVPARELSLQEIKAIKEEADIEIETFIHGAMCYCYSGQCLMSSMIGGRSGNRGRCAQPCRLPYSISEKEGYFLSLKDMDTLEHIPELIEAGIDSFKIEGRMKKPEYVAGVVSVYRKYIDKYYAEKNLDRKLKRNSHGDSDEHSERNAERENDGNIAKWNSNIEENDRKLLSNLYIRTETGNGYYDKAKGRDMLTLDKPGYNGADEKLLKWLRENYIRKLPEFPIKMFVRCKAGEPLHGEVRWNGQEQGELCLFFSGQAVEKADKRPATEEEIRAQLVKTGGTPFVVTECHVEISGNPFVPVKCLKELRRGLLQRIVEFYAPGREARDSDAAFEPANLPDFHARIRTNQNREQGQNQDYNQDEWDEGGFLTAVVQTREQFFPLFHVMKEDKGANKEKVPLIEYEAEKKLTECLVIDADLLLENDDIQELLLGSGLCWGIKCPVIIRRGDAERLAALRRLMEKGKPDMVYCATADVLSWLKESGCPDSWQGRIAGEASLYAWNEEACRFWGEELDRITVSPELSSREIRDLCQTPQVQDYLKKLEVSVYGRTPLMVTANCVKLSFGECDKDRTNYAKLTDRLRNVFPVYTRCGRSKMNAKSAFIASCKSNLRHGVESTPNCGKMNAKGAFIASCKSNLRHGVGSTPNYGKMNTKGAFIASCKSNLRHGVGSTPNYGKMNTKGAFIASCYNIIYNCLPTSYHDSLWMLVQDGIRNFRLDFTTENGAEAVQVWKTFKKLAASEIGKEHSGKRGKKKEKILDMETTAGRIHAGVE